MSKSFLLLFFKKDVLPVCRAARHRQDISTQYDHTDGHIRGTRLMSTYSVADAKANLPRLIDRAMQGEEVVITRHGKPLPITSVELLDMIYEQPD
jgi:prevent-host-death family protein